MLAVVMRHVLAPPCSLELFCTVRRACRMFSKVALRVLLTCQGLPSADFRCTFIPLDICGFCGKRGACEQRCATWFEFPFPTVVYCSLCGLYAVAAMLRLNMSPGLTRVECFPLKWSGFDVQELADVRLTIPRSDGSRSEAHIGTMMRILSSGGRGVDMVWFTASGAMRWSKTVPLPVLVELNPGFAPMASRLERAQCWAYSVL